MPYTGAKPKYSSNQGARKNASNWRNQGHNQERLYAEREALNSEKRPKSPNEKRRFNPKWQIKHVRQNLNQEWRSHQKESTNCEQHCAENASQEIQHDKISPYRERHYLKSKSLEEKVEIKREIQDQDDELLALASIYDLEVFHAEEGAYKGHFSVHIELPKPFFIKNFKLLDAAAVETSGAENEICVEYLPPIILQFRFPPNYPSQQMPNFLLRCSWLNTEQLSRLCKSLDKVWEDNKHEVILFRWIEFLKEEALTHLNIKDTLELSWIFNELKQEKDKTVTEDTTCCDTSFECSRPSSSREYSSEESLKSFRKTFRRKSDSDRRAIPEYSNVATLVSSLLEYNQMQKEKKFIMAVHFCNVCLEEKCGQFCTRFKECDHVFCKQCVKSFFEVQIIDGKVTALCCPFEKCSTQASQTLIRELVGEDLFSRYDRLLLSMTLDSMTDIQYCPRSFCQCAVVIDANSTMGTCPACFFAFCIFCRSAYHGVEPCKMKSEERRKLYENYKNGTEDEKRMLDSRYGRLQMRHLVDLTLSESWVDEHSKQCPHCRSNIEKIDGCNKMSCWKCGKYFCWTCMVKLSNVDPYKHYEDPNATCYNRLFTGAFVELEDDFENEFDDEDGSDSDDGKMGEYLL